MVLCCIKSRNLILAKKKWSAQAIVTISACWWFWHKCLALPVWNTHFGWKISYICHWIIDYWARLMGQKQCDWWDTSSKYVRKLLVHKWGTILPMLNSCQVMKTSYMISFTAMIRMKSSFRFFFGKIQLYRVIDLQRELWERLSRFDLGAARSRLARSAVAEGDGSFADRSHAR